jgi:DNA/RNA endonuclease G (NUC1)
MKKRILFFILFIPIILNGQNDTVFIKKTIYSVLYSQKLEQPLEITYRSTNRQSRVRGKNLNFYLEKGVHTSNNLDYHNNIYDKGHLVPAGSFSDNISNLKETYSFLNCVLQNQYLNRGEWRLLEERERVWDNKEPLTVKIKVIFDQNSTKLSTGATVPSAFIKQIFFERTQKNRCFFFTNEKQIIKWYDCEIKCE